MSKNKVSKPSKYNFKKPMLALVAAILLTTGGGLGFVVANVSHNDDGTSTLTENQIPMVRQEMFTEQIAQYNALVNKYNELAKQTRNIIDEHNALAPVINAQGIKPQGAGGSYFAMTYTAPSCIEAVPAPYAPISVGVTMVYAFQDATCV